MTGTLFLILLSTICSFKNTTIPIDFSYRYVRSLFKVVVVGIYSLIYLSHESNHDIRYNVIRYYYQIICRIIKEKQLLINHQ
jgi:hypothetical protein